VLDIRQGPLKLKRYRCDFGEDNG